MDLRQLHFLWVGFPGDPGSLGNTFRPQNVTKLRTTARMRPFSPLAMVNHRLGTRKWPADGKAGDRLPMPAGGAILFTNRAAGSPAATSHPAIFAGARHD
jgi:hypothetical protein